MPIKPTKKANVSVGLKRKINQKTKAAMEKTAVKKTIKLSDDPDLYFHAQAADLISDQEQHTAGMREQFANDMLKAIHAGALHVYSHREGMLRAFDISWTGLFCVRLQDVNDWLERKTQYKFRWNLTIEEGTTSSNSLTKPDQSPEPEISSVVVVVRHSTKGSRRRTLQPEIERAQELCKDRWDSAEVWAALSKLAEKKHGLLIGATEDGLQYLKDGEAANFTRDALRKRLKRGEESSPRPPISATNGR